MSQTQVNTFCELWNKEYVAEIQNGNVSLSVKAGADPGNVLTTAKVRLLGCGLLRKGVDLTN